MEAKKILRGIGRFIGGFLLFTGIILALQSYNLEKATSKENFVGFFQPKLEGIMLSKCSEVNISAENCREQPYFKNITTSLDTLYYTEISSPFGHQSISRIHDFSETYKTRGVIFSIIGFILLLFSLEDRKKILSSLGNNLFTTGIILFFMVYFIPKIIPTGESQEFTNIVMEWLDKNILSFNTKASIALIIIGITLIVSYHAINKLLKKAEEEKFVSTLNKLE